MLTIRISLIALVLLTSCSTQRRIEYHFQRLKKLGVEFKSDTVVSVKIDTLTINNEVPLLINDTIFEQIIKADTITKELIIKSIQIAPFEIADSSYHLKVWIEQGKIKHLLTLHLKREQITIQKSVAVPKKKNKGLNWLICLLSGFALGLLIRLK